MFYKKWISTPDLFFINLISSGSESEYEEK